jgi:hypothetical protein
MVAKRAKRPKLERDQPNRSWSTLFGAAPAKDQPSPANGPGGPNRPQDRDALSDSVQLGYRVIEDYLKQSQKVAQAFAPASFAAGVPTGSPEEMQQMAQRVMQYGWDFAGLWMEMWSRMGNTPGFRSPIPGMNMDPTTSAVGAEPARPGAAPAASQPSAALFVSVESVLPTMTSVELIPGQSTELVIHALRAEGHEAAPIRDVSIERTNDDGRLIVRVVIDAKQPPGEYRALIAEASSNLPRGTLSVRVQPKKR